MLGNYLFGGIHAENRKIVSTFTGGGRHTGHGEDNKHTN